MGRARRSTQPAAATLSRQALGRIIHRYGQVSILAVPDETTAARVPGATGFGGSPAGLNEVEQIGLPLCGCENRKSTATPSATDHELVSNGICLDVPRWCLPPGPGPGNRRAVGRADEPYLEGTVAVGIIIVQGPTAALQFSDDERTKVVAEVQNGLGLVRDDQSNC